MKIVADERIAALEDSFARHGALITAEGRDIDRGLLEDADALLVRTVTRVDRRLVEGTPVQFVGTATIGTDHLDTAWLDDAGIRWASAPGCNADATAQYTLAMYLLACRRLDIDPRSQRFGIVGRGNVGGRMQRLLGRFGIEAIAYDPPLEENGEPGLHPIGKILGCGAVSLHVPLTRGGRWPTYRMFNSETFDMLSTDSLLINTCRGDVVDGDALRQWQSRSGQAALDVWPGEPRIDPQVLEKAVVATPHIAGYSLDGKYRASAMIYRAFCDGFGFVPGPMQEPPTSPTTPELNIREASFMEHLLAACPVERDDAAMRTLIDLPAEERAGTFDALRSNYPLRRDLAL